MVEWQLEFLQVIVDYPDYTPQPDLPSLVVDPAPVVSVSGDGAVVDLLDSALVILFAVVALFICSSIAAGMYLFLHRAQHLTPDAVGKVLSHNALFEVSVEFSVYAFLIVFMMALVRIRHNIGLLRAVSWNTPDRKPALQALMIGAGTALFSTVAEVLLQRWTPKSLPINEFFRDRQSAFLLAGFGTLVAPFVEELVFRGFLYPAFARWIRRVPAIVVTAAGFTLLHGSQLAYAWAPLSILFVVGLVLTCARVITKSVAFTVLLHMGYNFTLFVQVFIGTQGFRNFR
jgi:membrane protease YdiL (CAAX protease family)